MGVLVRPALLLALGALALVGAALWPGEDGAMSSLAANPPYRLLMPVLYGGAAPATTPTQTPLPTPTPTPIPTPSPAPAFTRDQVLSLDLLNSARTANGVPPLTLDAAASAAAQGQADDMAARDYFSHDSPEGKTPWDWLREAGAPYIYAAQNLGLVEGRTNTESIRVLFDLMMAETPPEDGHRRNILNPVFRKLGAAVARSASGKLYWVNDFTD